MQIISSSRPHAILADTIVEDHTAVAMVASLIPIPLAEFAAIGAVHFKMVEKLAELYRIEFKPHQAKTIIASLVSSYVSTSAGSLAVKSLAKLVPGLGSMVSALTMPAVAGALTYAMGKVFVWHFESGGTLLNLDPSVAQAGFLREVEKRKAGGAAIAPASGASTV